MEELVTEPNIIEEIKSHCLRYLSFLERIEDYRIVKKAYKGATVIQISLERSSGGGCAQARSHHLARDHCEGQDPLRVAEPAQ